MATLTKNYLAQNLNYIFLALGSAVVFKVIQIICVVIFPLGKGFGQFPALSLSALFSIVMVLFFLAIFDRVYIIQSGSLLTRNNLKYVLIGAGFVVLTIVSSPSQVSSTQEVVTDLQSLWAKDIVSKILIFTSLVIYIPLVEEIIFRGFLFSSISKLCGDSWIVAAIISSFFFALFHFDSSVFVALLSLGMLSSWIFYQTKSVYCSFAVHALNNVIVLYISL